jgi:cell division protein FtsW (lipid II flippase)
MHAAAHRPLQVHSAWPFRSPGCLAAVSVRLGLALLALAMWAAVQHQRAAHEALLWQRLAPAAVERFVADLAVPPAAVAWPATGDAGSLARLCAEAPAAWAHWRRGWQRRALSHCLAMPVTEASTLAQAEAAALAQLQAQRAAAVQWLAGFDANEAPARTRLQADLTVAQAGVGAGAGMTVRPAPRQDLHTEPASAVREALQAALQRHDAALQAAQALPLPGRARALALQAQGLRWVPGATGPGGWVAVDRRSLAEALERLRRGAAALEGVSPLPAWRDLGAAIGFGGAVLLVVVALTVQGSLRRQVATVMAWGAWLALAAIGALALSDLALTGDAQLRLMALRQWLSLPLAGSTQWRVAVPGFAEPVPVFWPVVALAAVHGLPLMARLPAVRAVAGAAVRGANAGLAWVRAPQTGSTPLRWAAGQGALLLGPALVAGVALVGVGGSAALAELLLALALAGLAVYAATQATLANVQEGVAARPAGLALAALGAAWVGAVARGDLGHTVVTTLLGAVFVALFGWRWLRWALALCVAAGLAWLAASLAAQAPLPPLAVWVDELTPHARERVLAWFDPFAASSSDLARVRWLVNASGAEGWGLGRVPWEGLAPTGTHQGLPLQGPADYLFAVLAAVWGWPVALGLVVLQVLLFLGAGALGLRRAFSPGLPPLQRAVVAFGGLGCAVVALKTLLSVSGVVGLLPLTGIPVAVLGYGPAALGAAAVYLVAALWPVRATQPTPAGSVRLQRRVGLHAQQTHLGLLRVRQRALAVVGVLSVGAWTLAAAQWAARSGHTLPEAHVAVARAERAAQAQLADAAAPRHADFRTPNAWRAAPGCLRDSQGHPLMGVCDGMHRPAAWSEAAALWQADAGLQRHLLPVLALSLREPTGRTTWNGREVAQGADVQLQLDPQLQPLAQRLADCYTGRRVGTDCARVLPRDAAWAQRHFQGALRAGALGLVLAEADTGRVVAMANAVSDCTLANLQRRAVPDAQGRWPALRDGEACAALPDQRSARWAAQAPVHWLLPLGSSFKPWVVLAGLEAGLVNPAQSERWLAVLAKSEDQAAIQRLAIEGSPAFLATLAQAGYGQPWRDAAWGHRPPATQGGVPGWRVAAFEGLAQLQPARMGYERYRQIEADKRAGLNVDRRYGEPAVRDYLAARRLADASIGGGELRGSVFGLAQAWLDLVRQAHGQAPGPRLHLAAGQPSAPAVLGPAPGRRAQQQALWVLQASRGVTAHSAQGTAQGSCRVVFGACPAQGLPGFVGKTGTADFLVDPEGGHFAKPGLQLPVKVFGGSFVAASGRRYVVTAMALRVRQAGTATLELHSSAPAEAALTLARELGVAAMPAP